MSEVWPYDLTAEFYDVDMGSNADAADAAYYCSASQAQGRGRENRILELGCGTGRITLTLCEAGLDVVAVDRSVPMLRILQKRIEKRQLARKPLLAAMDMARLGFRGGFDVVLCPFSAFTYLVTDHDRDRALQSIGELLRRSGGRFLLDIFVPDPSIEQRFGEEIFDYRRPLPEGGWLERHKTISPTSLPGVNSVVRRYRFLRGDGICSTELVTESRQHSYRPDELLQLLRQAGFRIMSVYGDFAGAAFGPQSRLLIIEALPE